MRTYGAGVRTHPACSLDLWSPECAEGCEAGRAGWRGSVFGSTSGLSWTAVQGRAGQNLPTGDVELPGVGSGGRIPIRQEPLGARPTNGHRPVKCSRQGGDIGSRVRTLQTANYIIHIGLNTYEIQYSIHLLLETRLHSPCGDGASQSRSDYDLNVKDRQRDYAHFTDEIGGAQRNKLVSRSYSSCRPQSLAPTNMRGLNKAANLGRRFPSLHVTRSCCGPGGALLKHPWSLGSRGFSRGPSKT